MKLAEQLIDRMLREGIPTDGELAASGFSSEDASDSDKVHDAVLGWLDQHGPAFPTDPQAFKAMERAGIKDPRSHRREFFSDLQSCIIDMGGEG